MTSCPPEVVSRAAQSPDGVTRSRRGTRLAC
jgi:hypothetical protein